MILFIFSKKPYITLTIHQLVIEYVNEKKHCESVTHILFNFHEIYSEATCEYVNEK